MKIYLRALSMIISLVLVLSVIAYLRGGSFRQFITSYAQDFGLSEPPPIRPRSFRICRTRIESLEWANGTRIFEDKTGTKPRWMSQLASEVAARELDYLEVEKWFGINCVVKVGMMNPKLSGKLAHDPDMMRIHFVDQTIAHVKKNATSEFLFDQDFFKSKELSNSLLELYQMSQPPHGGADSSKTD